MIGQQLSRDYAVLFSTLRRQLTDSGARLAAEKELSSSFEQVDSCPFWNRVHMIINVLHVV